ncbi:efflux transporter outer membrane subunit [Arenimonas sp.]|uniref:efflux transporter outer membrane subunit n=1 Tax=Arenimonas sp. TaxID=1872635 RepID=UPI0039E54B04
MTNSISSRQRLALAVLLALGLSACASTYRAPALELPVVEPASAESAPTILTEATPELTSWWQSFNDPVLTALVSEALTHNVDVLSAMQSVEQSRSTLRQAWLTLLPDISAGGSVTRQQPSDYTAQPGQSGISNVYSAGFSASYEIDLWGRAWKARSAASSQLLASQYARDTVRSSIAAQTASSYFALLRLDAQLALLQQTQRTRSEALELQQVRNRAGVSGDYELQLAQAELAAIDAQLPATRSALTQAEAALAVLLGRSPRAVMSGQIERGGALQSLAATPEIPAGLPADLLVRRPDVRQAEALLAAADASLQETRRRYFPTLGITGFFGNESLTFSTLFDQAARSWNVAGAVTQPIVGLARTRAQVKAAQAAREQAELAYAQAARAAYGDVRSALAAHLAARETLQATQRRVDNQNRVKAIVEQRYEGGASSYLDLLNAERDRLAAESELISALQNRLTALVGVYQALGGGWDAAAFE